MNDRWHVSGTSPIHGNTEVFDPTSMTSYFTIHRYFDQYPDRGGLQVLGTNTASGAYDNYLRQSDGTNLVYRPQRYGNGDPIGNGAYRPNAPLNIGRDIISELRNAPGSQNGNIVPSVGIDTSDDIIHLSYSGIGDQGNPADVPENLSELQLDFSDFSSFNQYVADQFFINALCTPGTLWIVTGKPIPE